MNYLILGENIRKARKAANITQEKLSEYVNLSPAFISQIERSTRKPSLETVYDISVTLGVSVDDLLKGVSEAKDAPVLDKMSLLLKNRTQAEINLAISLAEKLLNNLKDGKVIEN